MNKGYTSISIKNDLYSRIENITSKKRVSKASLLEAFIKYSEEMDAKENKVIVTPDEISRKIGKIFKKTKGFKKYKLSDLDISNAY